MDSHGLSDIRQKLRTHLAILILISRVVSEVTAHETIHCAIDLESPLILHPLQRIKKVFG